MMKHIFTLTLLCFGLLAQAQIPSYVPTNGLVGWWPFNGNANDESGNGNHGTVNGATLAADRFGNTGKAYAFDGVDDVIKILFNSILSNDTGSLSLWMISNNLPTINDPQDVLFAQSLGYPQLVYKNNSKVNIHISSGPGLYPGIASQQSIQQNTWKNITAVYERSNLKIYIDGALDTFQNVSSITGFYSFCNSEYWIGGFKSSNSCLPNDSSQFFNGKIDDIAIYNRALSAAEVQQLYLGNSGNSASINTVPGKINYQGVAVGANGKPIKNGSVGLRLSVLDSTLNGGVLFSETKTVNTDASGLFATHVGGGTVTTGTFATIPWANGNDKFLKVEMDAQGGSNYQNMGTTQLVSVPYALHAGTAQSANTLRDSSGNAYQIKTVNGQPTLVPAPGSGSSSNPGSFACGQSVTYAGESYPTVQIGTQCWFQKNLNVGTMIQGANNQSNNSVLEKYCYNNLPANCDTFGGLYQWAEAVQYQNGASNTTSPSPAFSGNVKGMCPTGWHVPSDGEWCTLTTFLDSTVDCSTFAWSGVDVGGKLKSTSGLWLSPNTGATNSSGFSALPGGYRDNGLTFPTFFGPVNLSNGIYIWSISEYSISLSIPWLLGHDRSSINRSDQPKNCGFSVRCLKD